MKVFRPEDKAVQIAHVGSGIAISGGSVANPVVNNYAPAARKLTQGQSQELIDCLSKNRGSYSLGAIENSEAYDYAKSLGEVLLRAGWKNEEPVPVRTIIRVNEMWKGVRLMFYGEKNLNSNSWTVKLGSPEMQAFNCFNLVNLSVSAHPDASMSAGMVTIHVSEIP